MVVGGFMLHTNICYTLLKTEQQLHKFALQIAFYICSSVRAFELDFVAAA